VVVIAERRGQVAYLLPSQRPDRGPLDLRIRVKWHRDEAEATAAGVARVALAVLAFAEQQAIVGGNGGTAEFSQPRPAARFISSEDTGIALQPLAQRTGTGLNVAGAFAGIHGAQVAAQLTEAPGGPGAIAAGEINVQDAIVGRGGPLQHGHGAGERAHV